MPRRTNPFQSLIYLIQSQLAEDATVTESEMLVDKDTGDLVEVDIVVRSIIGEIPVVLGIECTAKTRPATIEWIREMIGKHEGLPIDKTILVSKSGYTKQALQKAKVNRVEALSLDNAKDTNWTEYIQSFQNLKLASFTFIPLSIRIETRIRGEDDFDREFNQHSQVYDTSNNQQATLKELVLNAFQSSNVGQKYIQKRLKTKSVHRDTKSVLNVTWRPPSGTTITDKLGDSYQLHKLIIRAEARVIETPIKLQPVEYQGQKMAHANVENIFDADPQNAGQIQITILESGGKLDNAGLLIPTKGEDKQIVVLSKSIDFVNE